MRRTINKKDIMQCQGWINGMLEEQGKTEQVSVEWAHGQPRAYLRDTDNQMIGPLSPRLRTGRMLDWLYAFEVGLRMGHR